MEALARVVFFSVTATALERAIAEVEGSINEVNQTGCGDREYKKEMN